MESEKVGHTKTLEKSVFLLTDGHEIAEAKLMTEDEAWQMNQRAEEATGRNWYWSSAGTPSKIVRAVNAHDELVDTIRWMAQTVHQAYHKSGIWQECHKNTCQAVQAAIAKAESPR